MKFIKDTTWQEVFEGWRQREGTNPAWIECATQVKGWPDWESWRLFTAQQLAAESREWKLFQFDNPIQEVAELLLGPYSGWQNRVVEKNNTSFDQFLDIPEIYQEYSQQPGIRRMIEGLPFSTELIGVLRKDNGKIICIEGHHRAVALVVAGREGKQIDFSATPITIALAEIPATECSIFNTMLARGTSKEPRV